MTIESISSPVVVAVVYIKLEWNVSMRARDLSGSLDTSHRCHAK